MEPMAEQLRKAVDTGVTAKDALAMKYDLAAGKYDEIYDNVGWEDPRMCAQVVLDNGFNTGTEILDMGCGTGLVGEHLKTLSGLSDLRLFGCDASDGMLKESKKRDIYKELEQIYLGNFEEFKSNHSCLLNRFDFITASGVMADFHAPSDILLEMNSCLKRGGILTLTTREVYLEDLGYQMIIDDFIDNNEWELMSKRGYEKFNKTSEKKVGDWHPIPAVHLTFKKL
mmetsp:Transcript_7857/g.8989  ORF Transcript_7857/g.8989 Transcript_7857/m.8989 type:complete len:227 (-) Transcript_7857:84-764(-)